MLKKGSRGKAVAGSQRWLNTKGFNAGIPDGVFGDKTEQAVRKFQLTANLKMDGVIGPVTENARRNWPTPPQRIIRAVAEPLKTLPFPRVVRFIVVHYSASEIGDAKM